MKTQHFHHGLLTVFLSATTLLLQGQTPSDAYVLISPDTGNNVKGFMHITLPDTNNIAAIEVKLGSTDGGYDLANYTFSYDVTGSLPVGYVWMRDGFKLILSLGSYPVSDLQFGRVRLQRSDGGWGDEFAFVRN
ncbi:MAG: hypothetical protein IPM91_01200 [Bacteroidetes bacterium]|nr:hypothetical protein [Bacteroidota bacterium]